MMRVQNRNQLKERLSMYEHPYIIGELQKQRALEIQKMVAETNMTKSKALISYLPYINPKSQYQSN
jgi:hypothetical protein